MPDHLQKLDLQGKTALVMGAGRGIGRATAIRLAQSGATVILTARSEQEIGKVAEEINKRGGRGYAVTCDVSDYVSVQKAVNYCQQMTGRLDILVNNAGVIEPLSLLMESDPEVWSLAVDINYKGVYYAIRAATSLMREKGGGVIINMSSGAANSALIGWSHYCSTKAAAKKLTEVADLELKEHGIRVVGLSPGTVATDMMAKIRDANINVVSKLEWSSHIPPEWAAEAVAFLCGPGGIEFAGSDFSIKSEEGRRHVGLPCD